MHLAGNAFIACFIYKIKESKTLCGFRTWQRSEFHCFPFYIPFQIPQLPIRHILTGNAYLQNAEQSTVDIILRSVELHMQCTPKSTLRWPAVTCTCVNLNQCFVWTGWVDVPDLCVICSCTWRLLSHIPCHVNAVEPSRCVGAGCTCSAFCVPRTPPWHCQWILGVQQVARNDGKFQIGISGSLHYQSLPISLWVIIKGAKWESAKYERYISCYS